MDSQQQQFESENNQGADDQHLDQLQARRPQIPVNAPQPVAQQQNGVSNGAQQFTEDEVQNLKEIFDLFDKEKV